MLTLKQKFQNLVFPLGSIQKIRKGYLKGYKIRLTENSLWSPLAGRWEPAMQKIMVNSVKESQVVYDLGANNGLHGLLMAGLVGRQGMVYNFEPFPANIEEIVENFQLNNLTNYRNIQAAVADEVGITSFSLGDHHKQGAITGNNPNGFDKIDVTTLTLDSFIEKGNPGPSFMKIDIEGAEGPALHGFSQNIEKYWPNMVIELHNPEQDAMVGKFLSFYKYKAYRFDPFASLKFTKVNDFAKVYPEPEGIWGSLFCVGPTKAFEDFVFDK
jgi:FkbM family methyltransferase